MFALRVDYLTGRAVAARFEDGDAKRAEEWPPHPARLFSALVAAWGETGRSDDGRRGLAWLEEQPAPALVFPLHSPRPIVKVYVPVNDTEVPRNVQAGPLKGAEEDALGVLPEFRSRQARSFPSLSLSETDTAVFFIWPEVAIPDNHRAALTDLAAATTYLGHSATLVGVSLCDDPPLDRISLLPDNQGDRRLRVPSPGRLDYLERQFRKFQANPIKVNRPNAGASARYRSPERDAKPPAATSIFREMVVFRRVSGDRLPLAGTLQILAALRGAVLSAGPQPSPEFLSGHSPASTPETPRRSDRPHVAFVPLADMGHDHARGHLLGVAALLPNTLTDAEADTVLETLAAVQKLTMGRAGEWTVEIVTAETANAQALRAATWTHLPRDTASTRWATVTPFVFDRFPKNHHGEEAQSIIADACEHVGLPRPTEIFPVQVSPHLGVPPAHAFPAAPARPGKPQRWHIHVLLSFPEPVAGPVVLGAGRYYGYGFCRPLPA